MKTDEQIVKEIFGFDIPGFKGPIHSEKFKCLGNANGLNPILQRYIQKGLEAMAAAQNSVAGGLCDALELRREQAIIDKAFGSVYKNIGPKK